MSRPSLKEDTKRNLTTLERAYVEEITRTDDDKPRSNTEALKRVHPEGSTMKNQQAVKEATRIHTRPAVKAAIRRIDDARHAAKVRHWTTTSRQIEEGLWKESQEADRSADRIAAYKALAAMRPEEEKKSKSLDSLTKDEVIDRVEALLSRVSGGTIDVTPAQSSELVPSPSPVKDSPESSVSDGEVLDVEVLPV